jgi:RsiW-degrading membrane proteinase PrsW (M82 family)
MENERQCVIPLHKPSLKELIFFFASGVLVSIPFALFFSQFYFLFPSALAVIILAPFIEELAKFSRYSIGMVKQKDPLLH